MSSLQHHPDGRLRHLLSLDGLGRDEIEGLLDRAEALRPQALDGRANLQALAGRTIVNLFFEPSTRTRSSFQLAARRQGAEVLNFDVAHSSSRKGETLLDTFRNLEAMGADAFVIRVAESGVLAELAAAARPHVHLVNAGDGRAAHPTQGLLDMLTVRQRKGRDFSRLKFVLVGDILHSRPCMPCAPWAPERSASAARPHCCRRTARLKAAGCSTASTKPSKASTW